MDGFLFSARLQTDSCRQKAWNLHVALAVIDNLKHKKGCIIKTWRWVNTGITLRESAKISKAKAFSKHTCSTNSMRQIPSGMFGPAALCYGSVQTVFLKSMLQAFHFQFAKVQSLGNFVGWYFVSSLFSSPNNHVVKSSHCSCPAKKKNTKLGTSESKPSLSPSTQLPHCQTLAMLNVFLTLVSNYEDIMLFELFSPRQVRSFNQTLDALQQIWGSQIDLIQNLRKGSFQIL